MFKYRFSFIFSLLLSVDISPFTRRYWMLDFLPFDFLSFFLVSRRWCSSRPLRSLFGDTRSYSFLPALSSFWMKARLYFCFALVPIFCGLYPAVTMTSYKTHPISRCLFYDWLSFVPFSCLSLPPVIYTSNDPEVYQNWPDMYLSPLIPRNTSLLSFFISLYVFQRPTCIGNNLDFSMK